MLSNDVCEHRFICCRPCFFLTPAWWVAGNRHTHLLVTWHQKTSVTERDASHWLLCSITRSPVRARVNVPHLALPAYPGLEQRVRRFSKCDTAPLQVVVVARFFNSIILCIRRGGRWRGGGSVIFPARIQPEKKTHPMVMYSYYISQLQIYLSVDPGANPGEFLMGALVQYRVAELFICDFLHWVIGLEPLNSTYLFVENTNAKLLANVSVM
jgi:hypothetical protein